MNSGFTGVREFQEFWKDLTLPPTSELMPTANVICHRGGSLLVGTIFIRPLALSFCISICMPAHINMQNSQLNVHWLGQLNVHVGQLNVYAGAAQRTRWGSTRQHYVHISKTPFLVLDQVSYIVIHSKWYVQYVKNARSTSWTLVFLPYQYAVSKICYVLSRTYIYIYCSKSDLRHIANDV